MDDWRVGRSCKIEITLARPLCLQGRLRPGSPGGGAEVQVQSAKPVTPKIYPSEVANKATLWEDSRRQPQGHAVAPWKLAAITFLIDRLACKK